ncbi:MAG: 30S ribosomal protein S17 [Candidatus Bathyarchaeia archaeon]
MSCNDVNCPFHGKLPLRGKAIEGVVVSDKMDKTVIIHRDYLRYVPKYKRYERRHSRIPAHNPPCIDARIGDKVRIRECRPISKTVSFVVEKKLKVGEGGS